jgi:hypothetical protein
LKCKVCRRQVQDKPQSVYCELHQKAYDNIQRKFEVWKKALNLDWETYLNEVTHNPLTGIWAREVAENLLLERKQRFV